MEHRHVGSSRSELILAGSGPLFLQSFRFSFAVIVLPFWLRTSLVILIVFPKWRILEAHQVLPSQRKHTWRCHFEIILSSTITIGVHVFRIFITKRTLFSGCTWMGIWFSIFILKRELSKSGLLPKRLTLGNRRGHPLCRLRSKSPGCFPPSFCGIRRMAQRQKRQGSSIGFTTFFSKRWHGCIQTKHNKTMVFLGSAHLSQVGGGVIHKHIARYWGNFCKHAAACQSLSNSIHSTNFVPMVPFYLGSRQRMMTSSIKPAQGKLMPFPAILRMLAWAKSEKSTGSWKSTSQENAVISRNNPKLEWCEVESC